MKLDSLVRTLPKAELHVHLEGAITPTTALKLAHKYSHLGFVNAVELMQKSISIRSFEDFHSYYQVCMQLIRSAEDFALVVYECGRDMMNQNIRYREMYISIYQHLHLWEKNLHLQDVFDGLLLGCQKARDDFDVEMQWIFGIPRNRHFSSHNPRIFDSTIATKVLDYALQGREYGVIGIGLGGNEVDAPPEPFGNVFQQAKQMGLQSIPHAGETDGANSVRGAIKELQADRICHGVRSIEDMNVVKELAERQIPLDICPTSNIRLNIYPTMSQHPFQELDKLGVIVTINSDDPSIIGSSLCDEYIAVAKEFGYTIKDLVRFARNSIQASYTSSESKTKCLLEIEQWEKSYLSNTSKMQSSKK
ncbi:MAG: adenosine deaminase [Anaerolineae bacterium]|nr:adenosine deaminase [Anaerolineae bacterium]MCI0608469.1 adenosine deaminase [Anaerolineae bacterium]